MKQYSCVNGHQFDAKEAQEIGFKSYACPECWPNGFLKKRDSMLIPNKGRVIVKKIIEEKKEGSLILPDIKPNMPYWAEVTYGRIGENFTRGTKVLVPAYAGAHINHEGEDLIILKEEEILCYY